MLGDANNLFRRHTDQEIKRRLGKQPLDVGAHRIARTAHAALRLLAEVRELAGLPIPLAWEPGFDTKAAAIEVYPAATLQSLGPASGGDKAKGDAAKRKPIVAGLTDRVDLADRRPGLVENADVMDAAVCVVAGAEFLDGRAVAPLDRDVTLVEGWIWVRK